MDKNDILGVGITKASEDEILEYIIKKLEKTNEKITIFTPNPEIIVKTYKDPAFKKILNSADISLPDGEGVVIASRFMRKNIKKRITGVDFMVRLCERVSQHNIGVKRVASKDAKKLITTGFIGGQEGVAEEAAKCLKKKYPTLCVNMAKNEWSEADLYKKTDILFVAFGAPKQEKWICDNIQKLPVRVMMSVGGSFDVLSGRVARAPKFFQFVKGEWLFRLAIQPWRWKRQLALIEFIFLVASDFFRSIFKNRP